MPRKTRTKARAAKARGGRGPRRRGMPLRWFRRLSLALVLLGVAAIAWMSVLSFSPADPPLLAAAATTRPAPRPSTAPTQAGSQPATSPAQPAGRPDLPATAPPSGPSAAKAQPAARPSRPPRNTAGLAGAYIAYGLLHYVGAGTYVALAFLTVAAALLIFRGRIPGLPVRLCGAALLASAVSAVAYLAEPSATADPIGGGAGRLGIAAGRFLLSRFAVSGAWTVVTVALAVGCILTAERLLLVLPHWIARALKARRQAAEAAAAAAAGAGLGGPDAPADRSAQGWPSAGETAARRALRLEQIRRRLAESSAAPAASQAPAPAAADTAPEPYDLPSPDLLAAPAEGRADAREASAAKRRELLQQALGDFGVAAEVVAHQAGPVVTMFELSLAAGVKVSEVSRLAEDIARSLAVANVRVVSPLPGRATIGVEVPNEARELVRLRELTALAADAGEKLALPLYLGKDVGGAALTADLAAMPHLLIAGTTGSGKSVFIHSILLGLLMHRRPEEVRLVLVDPKMVEMSAYEEVPHLLCPAVTDMARAASALAWAAARMDERYALLRDAGVRNIADYNALAPEELSRRLGSRGGPQPPAAGPARLPYYVIVVDELADLMMTAGKEVEAHIVRIAQKARAVGVHLVLATQRPSVEVVTGLIKSNMPCRLSFRVASQVESRIILDQNGAEVLLGHGDMLLLRPGAGAPVRAQGTFVDDVEIRAVSEDLRAKAQPQYAPDLLPRDDRPSDEGTGPRDELFRQAVAVVLAARRGSVSLLQRELAVGYARASALIDRMTEVGILGEHRGSRPRECLITLQEWRRIEAAIGQA